MITKQLAGYTLNIINIVDFKDYYYGNLNMFSTNSMNAFLKALDIPPKFFKEQPNETKDELIENRDIFIREHKKYIGKVIVTVVAKDGGILNACRMDGKEAEIKYEKLKDISEVSNKFEHRSFIKDGYTSFVVSEDIKKSENNQVLVVDFPIMMNKPVLVHKAVYTLPADDAVTPVEHIHYLTNEEIDLDFDYNSVKAAVEDRLDFLTDKELSAPADENILRENELVALALVETGTIPKSYKDKVSDYITENLKGELTTHKLENLVLDFDEELRTYKQVTSLREVSGYAVKKFLDSDQFKAIEEELKNLDSLEDEVVRLEKELMI